MLKAPARITAAMVAALLLVAGLVAVLTALPPDHPDAAGEREDVPSALDDPRNAAFPEPLIDPDDLASGGPPPDGIPPLDDPKFERASKVNWLAATEPVLALTVGDETRAYPLQVMMWHEIVNDMVDGTPVAVTYCPLCNSGVAFHRRVGKRMLDFGTSGLLYADNLVMYDRQTESLWPQLTGQASVGVLTGVRLKAIPIGVTGWEQFRDAHPDSLVLTRDTGFDRPYGTNAYVGYDSDSRLLVEPPRGRDPRLPVKERVIGLRLGDEAIAVPRSAMAGAGVLTIELDDQPIVLLHQPGQASALDTRAIRTGADIGTVGVFRPRIDGRSLTFAKRGHGFVDAETVSTWNVLGQATKGPLAGRRLPLMQHLDTFWFAWVAFQPKTEIYAP